jgi:CelD/BcsL family acetyltransferase involved in cellulose biosynthesis
MGQRVEWIVDNERFAAIRQPWNELAATHTRPFSEHEWFSHWWEAFGAGHALRVCALWREDELAAAFPLLESGGSLEALANDHTPVFVPLARSADDLRQVSEAVLAHGGPTLKVPCLPAGEAACAELQRASQDAKRWLVTRPMHTSPIVRITGPLEEYLATPGLKGPLPRYRRKMAREYDAEFDIVCEPADVGRVLDEGFELEAAGWKGRAGSAVASSPVTDRFYRAVAQSLSARGELRVSCIRLDGALVAFDLCALRDGRLWLLKTAYDERYSRLAPGLVLRLSVIERCFELRLDAHELGGQAQEWKLRFANDRRSHVLLTSYARRPAAALRVGWNGHARPLLVRARRALIAARRRPLERA